MPSSSLLRAADAHWPAIESPRWTIRKLIDHDRRRAPSGLGHERAWRVFESARATEDWVLVHDAARPCLTPEDCAAARQRSKRSDQASGALLAVPVVDTVKRDAWPAGSRPSIARDCGAH